MTALLHLLKYCAEAINKLAAVLQVVTMLRK